MKLKKILAMVLCLCMVLSTMGTVAFAADTDVAKINGQGYPTLSDAISAAKAGDTITLMADITLSEKLTLPANITLNGNGKTITGEILASGNLTFAGHTKVTAFNAGSNKPTITIGEGACLEIIGTGRMVIGHGATFNITGNITDAKTADTADYTPSLIMPGASFTGAGVTFNVTNAYIKTTAQYCSSSKTASGTFDFDITNSIWEQFGKLAFESQSTAATVNFELKDSVLTTTSHLVFGVSRGNIVIDNSNVNVGKSYQIENQSTMTVKNGSVVNGAVATSDNAKNPGTLIIDNATYNVSGEFSGSDLGTGTLIVKNNASFTAGSITKANIVIDATNMTASDFANINANLSKFVGTLTVENNSKLEAKIDDNGNIVLTEHKLLGSGANDDPYIISDLKDLKLFRDNVNEGTTYLKKYVKLAADIDLNNEEWTPIGTSKKNFQGTFDGADHTISNLVITGNKNDVGLFGFTTSGEIKNLTLNNAKVSGNLDVGALAGTPYASKYTNITVTGHVEINGSSYVGGVGGKNAYADWTNITVDVDGTSYVKAISTVGDIDYRTYVGGVIGFMGEGKHTVKDVTSNINVIGDVCDIGGIVGIAHYGNIFENIKCSGSVTNTNTDPECVAETGGIAGVWHNQKGYTVTFTDCEYTGDSNVPLVGAAYDANNKTEATSGSLIINGNPSWPNEARIDTTAYATFADALAAVEDGQTITLARDIELENAVALSKEGKFIIDGNGHSIKQAAGFPAFSHALMLGNSDGAYNANRNYTIKNVVFDGWSKTDRTLRLESANVSVENCTFKNITKSAHGGIVSFTYTEGQLKDSTFVNNNAGLLIDVNYNNNDSTNNVTIDGCLFEENTSNSIGLIYTVVANSAKITNSKFINNNVDITSNGALIYAGCASTEITGSYFSGNTFKTISDSQEVAAVVYDSEGAKIENNVFVNNKGYRNDAEEIAQVVAECDEADSNLSKNYWSNGEEPVYGVDYARAYNDKKLALDTYYVHYDLDKDGKLVFGKLVDLVNEITVKFEKAKDENGEIIPGLYDINLVGDKDKELYEFVSAELTFKNESTTAAGKPMEYIILPIEGKTAVDANYGNTSDNTKTFGIRLVSDAVRPTDKVITIAQVKFDGVGTIDFELNTDTAAKNKVVLTKYDTNLGKYYTVADKTLVAGEKISGGDIGEVLKTVKVKISFNHPIRETNYWTNNQFTVTLTDSFDKTFTKEVELKSATEGEVVFNDVHCGMTDVKLEAPGFRTYPYSTLIEEEDDAEIVLNFWNDVKRNKTDENTNVSLWAPIREGFDKTMEANFVVGDIVMDHIVDKYDLAAVTSYYGMYGLKDANKYLRYDLNRDGNIDIIDVHYVLHTLNH